MALKSLLLSLLALFSFQAFSYEQVVLVDENSREVLDQLKSVKRSLEKGQTDYALSKVNDLISQLSGQSDNQEKTYSRIGVMYNDHDSTYRCDSYDKARAKRAAQNAATSDCYEDGARDCKILSTFIKTNGDIGTINGTYYGYGCVAKSVVRGTF